MNVIEALNALKEGKRVRNKIWEEGEYIMLKNGFIKYGNGVTHRIDVYGEYDMCDDTWEEYKEPALAEAEKEYEKLHLGRAGAMTDTIRGESPFFFWVRR